MGPLVEIFLSIVFLMTSNFIKKNCFRLVNHSVAGLNLISWDALNAANEHMQVVISPDPSPFMSQHYSCGNQQYEWLVNEFIVAVLMSLARHLFSVGRCMQA